MIANIPPWLREFSRDIAKWSRGTVGPSFVGLCGAQGSGKSTLTDTLRCLLKADGIVTCTLSLDDFYLGREQRATLARDIHPLLATRGPPGTHDIELLNCVVSRLAGEWPTLIPRFSKAQDDMLPEAEWPLPCGPFDLILLEGWCVGARPQSIAALEPAVNRLEADEDPEGCWRRYVNDALHRYQALFSKLDLLVMLMAPSFDVVAGWRDQQEQALVLDCNLATRSSGIMSADDIRRFVQHFERLTRHMLEEMPMRADVLIELGPAREIRAVQSTRFGGLAGSFSPGCFG